MSSAAKRNIPTTLLFLSVVFLPWYVYLFLIVIALFVFKKYKEGVILAVFSDMVFGYKGAGFFGVGYSTTLVVGAFFILSLLLRDKLRFIYDHS